MEASLIETASFDCMPSHVAIIMDGNGRWAKKRKKNRIFGHRRGAQVMENIIAHAAKSGVRYLTLYGFSKENWHRPPTEVRELMVMMRFYLAHKIADIHAQNLRLIVIGARADFDTDIIKLIDEAENLTRNNSGMTLVMALSYGGKQDILRALQNLSEDLVAGRMCAEELTTDMLAKKLDTGGIPDPDLMIRTSGEYRLSNFLLFQLAYTELYFTDTLWPDFDAQALDQAFLEYAKRHRRYGRLALPQRAKA